MKTVRILPILSILVSLTVSVAALAASSQELGKASKLHNKGERALRAGKIGDAKEAFEKSLDVVPGFPAAHIGLGQICMAEKKFEEALSHFEQARDGFVELGSDLQAIQAKRYAQAQDQIISLRDSIQHLQGGDRPGGAADRIGLRVSAIENSISQLQAIEPPEKGKADEPPGEVYFYIGNALFQLGRLDEAVTAWESCRDRSPEFPMVYNNLALAYWKKGELTDAVNCLEKAEELGFPVNPQFKTELNKAKAKIQRGT